MKQVRSIHFKAAAAALALAAMGTAGVAQARGDVYWSIGVNAAPGVAIGVGNGYPVYAPPVYYAPPPVVYYPSTYYVRPAPVYYSSGYYYGPTYYRVHGRHKHWRHHSHRRHDGHWRY